MAGPVAIPGGGSPTYPGVSTGGAAGAATRSRLRPEDLTKLQRLQAKDRELRLAHTDPSRLRYEIGPDGRRYASSVTEVPAPPREEPSLSGGDSGTNPGSSSQPAVVDPSAAGEFQADSRTDPGAVEGETKAGVVAPASARKKKSRPGLGLPDGVYHPLTPSALLRQAQVEAAYLAQAATPPRINTRA